MTEVKRITGRGIPLKGDDIDTDRIVPARFLRCVTFDGLGEQVFADDRTQAQKQHPFDNPVYQGATLLVVNKNFGCGSSREHAPQALIRWGVQAIIGESFAEIFFGNCLANGIPCVSATAETVQQLQTLLERDPQRSVTLDLQTLQVQCGDLSASITKGEDARQMLLTGRWDTCGQLLQNTKQIQQTAQKIPYLAWNQPATDA